MKYLTAEFFTTTAAVISALLSILMAWRAKASADRAERSEMLGIIAPWMTEYGSPEMNGALLTLRKHTANHQHGCLQSFMAQHTKNADNEVNNARRYVANHFFKIGILFKRRLLSKEIALLLVTVDQAKFIRVVLEPMERCIVGYDPSWYLALLNLHGLNPLVIENNIIPVDELRPLGLM